MTINVFIYETILVINFQSFLLGEVGIHQADRSF